MNKEKNINSKNDDSEYSEPDEESKVRLVLHPDDQPVHKLGGVPCLISYKRVFDIANSPYLGMEFCAGLTGGWRKIWGYSKRHQVMQ